MENIIYTQRSTRKLIIHASGIADIDGQAASNDDIGRFMREYVAEQIEDAFRGGHEHNGCCEVDENEYDYGFNKPNEDPLTTLLKPLILSNGGGIEKGRWPLTGNIWFQYWPCKNVSGYGVNLMTYDPATGTTTGALIGNGCN